LKKNLLKSTKKPNPILDTQVKYNRIFEGHQDPLASLVEFHEYSALRTAPNEPPFVSGETLRNIDLQARGMRFWGVPRAELKVISAPGSLFPGLVCGMVVEIDEGAKGGPKVAKRGRRE
jgi:hypothetical protein